MPRPAPSAHGKRAPAESRVLVISGDLGEMLVLRRLVLSTPHAVESVRSPALALALLAQQRYDAVIADEAGLSRGAAAQLLNEIALRRPEMLRVLLAGEASTSDDRHLRILRPYFARPLRDLLIEHEAQRAATDEVDDTVRTVLAAESLNG